VVAVSAVVIGALAATSSGSTKTDPAFQGDFKPGSLQVEVSR
jgi:hypothetical protein